MNRDRNIQTFIGCDASYADARVVLFGAPFDGTACYRPGARFAPQAIRRESYGIETYSPYQDRDLLDYAVFDGGDLELCFGNPARILDEIEAYTAEVLTDGKLPFMLGGEHLVTLGAVRAAAKRYPDLHIIHFDAHADFRQDYLGETLSHSTVMRRCWDVLGDRRIYQFGVRSGDKEEFDFAKSHAYLRLFDFEGLEHTVEKLKGKPVYFTVDLDVLDPSEFSGTGTPEAGGQRFTQLLDAIQAVTRLEIVGLDMNELSPPWDASGVSTALACKLLREMLLRVLEGKGNRHE